jgi:hypothetical protein
MKFLRPLIFGKQNAVPLTGAQIAKRSLFVLLSVVSISYLFLVVAQSYFRNVAHLNERMQLSRNQWVLDRVEEEGAVVWTAQEHLQANPILLEFGVYNFNGSHHPESIAFGGTYDIAPPEFRATSIWITPDGCRGCPYCFETALKRPLSYVIISEELRIKVESCNPGATFTYVYKAGRKRSGITASDLPQEASSQLYREFRDLFAVVLPYYLDRGIGWLLRFFGID